VREVEPFTQIPEVCELPTELQPAHELPPLMSTMEAEASFTPKVLPAKTMTMVEKDFENITASF
jgi:hypothetical protein